MSGTMGIEDKSIDSVLLTSVPGNLGSIVRSMKPGSHLLLLSAVKQHHLGTIEAEDNGLEIRDTIAYVFADGENDMGMVLVMVARKPLEGTVAENALKYGTGGINVDKCRILTDDKLGGGKLSGPTSMKNTCGGNEWDRPWMNDEELREGYALEMKEKVALAEKLGRWPANLILHDCPTVRAMFPFTKSGKDVNPTSNSVKGFFSQSMSYYSKEANYGDSGSAARFFYSAPCLNNLCNYLIRLITPPGGTVLTSYGFPVATDDFHLIEYREGYSLGRSI